MSVYLCLWLGNLLFGNVISITFAKAVMYVINRMKYEVTVNVLLHSEAATAVWSDYYSR